VGERPLPGRRKARRLRPGISKHLGNRWEDGSTPMWDSLRHLSGFFEGQSPPRGSERLDTRGGQDLQKNAQKQRGGGPMDDRRRMKISGAKKGRGEVGGLDEGQLVMSPTTFFRPSRSTCWLEFRQPPAR